MNNKITEKEAVGELIKQTRIKKLKENKIDINNTNNNKLKINENYKEKYEDIKRKEELLNAKIKLLEENSKFSGELKKRTSGIVDSF